MFDKIAPYLTNPLVLIGFVLLLVFGFYQVLIRSGIIPPMGKKASGRTVQALVWGTFGLAVLVIVLGFGLQFYQSHLDAAPSVDVNSIVDKLVQKSEAATRLKGENQFLRQQLAESVEALAKKRGLGIKQALALLEQGKTKKAEGIFQATAQRNKANIAANSKEAAAAYRHLGALAYLNDPQKALDAYRRATELDPDNAAGWLQLGNLQYRTGELNEAEAAFHKVLSLGQARHDRSLLAMAYGNLGLIYRMRGNLEQAEAAQHQALEINQALGNKEGMANNYGNLGIAYQTRGDLEQAEARYRKALELFKELGAKRESAQVQGLLDALQRR